MEKVARGELWKAKASLDKFFGEKIEGIPAKVGFRLAQLARKVDKEHGTLERERLRLIRIYGEPDDKGAIRVTEERQEDFYKEFLPLVEEMIDSPILEKIVLPPDVLIPLDVLKDLEPFIEIQD
ncbi:MAG: hypothetical protein SVK08_00540 [Halobacteriota archaeon]|nr:hypothetical protein [Halobacteriota archaeon]